MKRLFPFLLIIILVTLACGAFDPDNALTPAFTEAPASTEASAPVPTVEVVAPVESNVESDQFFTEEFDGDTSSWTALPLRDKAESEKMDFFTENSALVFDMKGNDGLGTLLTYDPYTYANVRIDAHVENLNNDQGAVSLICRYNGENWYQFFATTTGYYGIYYVFWGKAPQTNARYQELFSGATDKMVLGPGVNDYSAVCDGKTLSFFINGTEVRTIQETAFNLTSAGQVAIAAYTTNKSSFDISFDSVKISEP